MSFLSNKEPLVLENKTLDFKKNTFLNIPSGGTNAKKYNVYDYGVTGDGTTDDSVSFQAAVTAAILGRGTIEIPSPANFIKITQTINFQPASGTEVYVNLSATGSKRSQIRYFGANNTACFSVNGLRTSIWMGLGIVLDDVHTGCVGVELDTTGTSSSLSYNTFIGCDVILGAATGQRGWRMGHVSANGADISGLIWMGSLVYGNGSTPVSGHIGWHFEGSNTLDNKFIGCFGAGLDIMVSNVEGAGAASLGNGAFYFYDQGTSGNNLDYKIQNLQNLTIVGGRYESGLRMLEVVYNNRSPIVSIIGVEIDDYHPADGILIYCDMPTNISIRDASIVGRNDWDDRMITLLGGQYGANIGVGRLIVEGGKIQCPGSVFHRALNSTEWRYYFTGVGRCVSDEVVTGLFPDLPSSGIRTVSSAVTLNANDNTLLANTASAFTITLPLAASVTGQAFTIKKISSDGNAVTIDGNGSEVIDGDLTKTLTTQWQMITIKSNGTSWYRTN